MVKAWTLERFLPAGLPRHFREVPQWEVSIGHPNPSLKARPFSASYVTRASLLAAWALGTVSKSTYFVDSKSEFQKGGNGEGRCAWPWNLGEERETGLGMTCLRVIRLENDRGAFFFWQMNQKAPEIQVLLGALDRKHWADFSTLRQNLICAFGAFRNKEIVEKLFHCHLKLCCSTNATIFMSRKLFSGYW